MSEMSQNAGVGSKENPINLNDSSEESDSDNTITSEEYFPTNKIIQSKIWSYFPRKPTRGRPRGASMLREHLGKTRPITSKNIKRGRPRKGSIFAKKFKGNANSTKPGVFRKKRRTIKRKVSVSRQPTPNIPEEEKNNEEVEKCEIGPIFEHRLTRKPLATINEDVNESTSATSSQENNKNKNKSENRLIMRLGKISDDEYHHVKNFRKRGPKRSNESEQENAAEGGSADFEHNDNYSSDHEPGPSRKRKAPPEIDSNENIGDRNVLKQVILDEVFNSNHTEKEKSPKQSAKAEKLVLKLLKNGEIEKVVCRNNSNQNISDENNAKKNEKKRSIEKHEETSVEPCSKLKSRNRRSVDSQRRWESVLNNSEVRLETRVQEDDNELTKENIGEINQSKCYGKNVQKRLLRKSDVENGKVANRRNNLNLLFSEDFEFQIHKSQTEAIRGQIHGSFCYAKKFAGIPNKKFGKKDLDKFGQGDIGWPIQAIHETSDPNLFFVLYEGWSAETGCFLNLKEIKRTAAIMLEECRLRSKIMRAIERKVGCSLQRNFDDLKKHPDHLFWVLEDMTFFQNEIRKDRNFSTVFYLSTTSSIKEVPHFVYTNKNLVERNAEKMILNNRKSVNIDELMNKSEYSIKVGTFSCNSPNCKCDIRQELVYKGIKDLHYNHRLKYHKTGLLDLSEFEIDQRRYIIECSDACGCDLYCPTRKVQRGQTIPLVISYENFEKGYGVRAGCNIKKGQFICEYTGVARKVNPKRDDKYTLEFGTILDNCAIDAMRHGNVARFMNHSCSPNSMYVEAHARVKENTPLLPRVGIFALEDIEIGEEITVSYYSQECLKEAAKRSTGRYKCFCNSKKCRGWMPKYVY